jgi:hypothetical protein
MDAPVSNRMAMGLPLVPLELTVRAVEMVPHNS